MEKLLVTSAVVFSFTCLTLIGISAMASNIMIAHKTSKFKAYTVVIAALAGLVAISVATAHLLI
jgi:hypothetical protein